MDKSKLVVSLYDKIAQVYTDQYFDYAGDNAFLEEFLAEIPINGKVLDVGCGPGNITKYISNIGFRAEGVDLSKEMIKIAQEKVPECNFEVMDMRNLKYPDNMFDGLITAYSLIHIPSIEIPMTLSEFHRVLKPTGILAIIVQEGESDQIVNEPLKPEEKTFINFFTKTRLANYLKQARFKITFQGQKPLADADSLSNKVIYTLARKL